MMCPKCGHSPTQVIDSREQRDGRETWRRRRCPCGYKWSTIEVYSTLLKRTTTTAHHRGESRHV